MSASRSTSTCSVTRSSRTWSPRLGAGEGRQVAVRRPPAPGMGLPCGQVGGLPSRMTSRSSTSSEMTCSQRHASTWALCQGRPITSVSRRSARRCLRTTLMARPRPLSGQGDEAALGVDPALAPQPADHLRHRRRRTSEPLGQAGLDDRDAFLLQLQMVSRYSSSGGWKPSATATMVPPAPGWDAGGAVAIRPPYHRPRGHAHAPRRQLAGLPGLLRPAHRHGHRVGPGHQRRLRLHVDAHQPAEGPHAGPDRGGLRPARAHLPPRAGRRLQGGPGGGARHPAPADGPGPPGGGDAADPDRRAGRLRGRRHHRHPGHRGPRPGRRRHHRHRRPRRLPTGRGPPRQGPLQPAGRERLRPLRRGRHQGAHRRDAGRVPPVRGPARRPVRQPARRPGRR